MVRQRRGKRDIRERVWFTDVRAWLQQLLLVPSLVRSWMTWEQQSRRFWQWFVPHHLQQGARIRSSSGFVSQHRG